MIFLQSGLSYCSLSNFVAFLTAPRIISSGQPSGAGAGFTVRVHGPGTPLQPKLMSDPTDFLRI